MDVRGSGNSEGSYEFLSPDEQQDYYETIEWVRSSPGAMARSAAADKAIMRGRNGSWASSIRPR